MQREMKGSKEADRGLGPTLPPPAPKSPSPPAGLPHEVWAPKGMTNVIRAFPCKRTTGVLISISGGLGVSWTRSDGRDKRQKAIRGKWRWRKRKDMG